MNRRAFVGGLALSLVGCGGGRGGGHSNGVALAIQSGGIPTIEVNGRPITIGGGHYFIASCDGSDGPFNITSSGRSGQTDAFTSCPASQFQFSATQQSPTQWLLDWYVKAGSQLNTASLPMDLDPAQFTNWTFGNAYRVQMGCGAQWRETGATGAYQDIVQPCLIPGAGMVGLALADGATWMQASGPRVIVRRTLLVASQEVWMAAYSHPGTRNLELSYMGSSPRPVAPGTLLHTTEQLDIVAV